MSNFKLNTAPTDATYSEIRSSEAYRYYMRHGANEQQLVSEMKVEIREVLLKMAVPVVVLLLVYLVVGYFALSMVSLSENNFFLMVQCIAIAIVGWHYVASIIRLNIGLGNVIATILGIATAKTFSHLMAMVVELDEAYLNHEAIQEFIEDLNAAQVACLDLQNTTPEIVVYSGQYIDTPERHYFAAQDSFWIEGREIGKTLTFVYPNGNIEFTYHSCQRGVNLSEIRTEIYNTSEMVGYLIQDPKTPGFGMAILYSRVL